MVVLNIPCDQHPLPGLRLPGEGRGAYGVAGGMGVNPDLTHHDALAHLKGSAHVLPTITNLQSAGRLDGSHRSW